MRYQPVFFHKRRSIEMHTKTACAIIFHVWLNDCTFINWSVRKLNQDLLFLSFRNLEAVSLIKILKCRFELFEF